VLEQLHALGLAAERLLDFGEPRLDAVDLVRALLGGGRAPLELLDVALELLDPLLALARFRLGAVGAIALLFARGGEPFDLRLERGGARLGLGGPRPRLVALVAGAPFLRDQPLGPRTLVHQRRLHTLERREIARRRRFARRSFRDRHRCDRRNLGNCRNRRRLPARLLQLALELRDLRLRLLELALELPAQPLGPLEIFAQRDRLGRRRLDGARQVHRRELARVLELAHRILAHLGRLRLGLRARLHRLPRVGARLFFLLAQLLDFRLERRHALRLAAAGGDRPGRDPPPFGLGELAARLALARLRLGRARLRPRRLRAQPLALAR